MHSFLYFRQFPYLCFTTGRVSLRYNRRFGMKYITTFELKEKMDKGEAFQIIDTREPEMFEECHIEGAISMPQIDLPELSQLISREIPVIIYCIYGVKSQAPYLYLTEKLKFRNIYILDGGIYQWATDIDPSLPVA